MTDMLIPTIKNEMREEQIPTLICPHCSNEIEMKFIVGLTFLDHGIIRDDRTCNKCGWTINYVVPVYSYGVEIEKI